MIADEKIPSTENMNTIIFAHFFRRYNPLAKMNPKMPIPTKMIPVMIKIPAPKNPINGISELITPPPKIKKAPARITKIEVM